MKTKPLIPRKIAKKFEQIRVSGEEVNAYVADLWDYDNGTHHVLLTSKRLVIIRNTFFETEILEHKLPDDLDDLDFNEGWLFDTIKILLKGAHQINLNFWSKNRRKTLRFFRELEKRKLQPPIRSESDEKNQ